MNVYKICSYLQLVSLCLFFSANIVEINCICVVMLSCLWYIVFPVRMCTVMLFNHQVITFLSVVEYSPIKVFTLVVG